MFPVFLYFDRLAHLPADVFTVETGDKTDMQLADLGRRDYYNIACGIGIVRLLRSSQ